MKKTITTCDHCSKEIVGDVITLGSENHNELFFENKTKDATVETLERYRDLHFCCKDHFINYFFEPIF